MGTGLALPAVVGGAVRLLLQARGEPVVAVRAALEWLAFGTLCYALPFVALAFVGRALLRRAPPQAVARRLPILWGALLGMAVAEGWSLVGFFRDPTGPQVLLFVPVYPFFPALLGAAVGVVAGWAFRRW